MFLGAELDLAESTAMTASVILDVCTVPANSHGNATARRVGEDFSVTKVSLCPRNN